MKRRNKSKKKKGRSLQNLWYWLRCLYRESPLFCWLYLAIIPLTVGISLLGAYLPSVLVGDITNAMPIGTVLIHLVLLGGGLTVLHIIQTWIVQTQGIVERPIVGRQTIKMAEAVMQTRYSNIENGQFPDTFWQLFSQHMWEGTFSSQFLNAFVATASAAVGMLLYTGMLSGLSLWILLPVLAGTGINYVTVLRCNRWDAANRHKWWALDNRLHYLGRESSSFEAAKDVHLYHMTPWLDRKFDRELKQRVRYTARVQANYFTESSVNSLTQMIWEGAAYLYLIFCVCNGTLDAAGFVLYIGIVTGFASWCRSIVGSIKKLHEMALHVEEQRTFMDKMTSDREENREELKIAPGHLPEISFYHVTFQYEGADEPVLRNLNLTLKPGENLALVGLNGAGKTTFIKLLCGFYDPTEGEIRIDGIDRSRYSRESWLRLLSGVFQDKGFFPVSLRDNLVPERNADENRLQECLRLAEMAERLQKLPAGLDTMYGVGIQENAVAFSGGEEQRLMLARALYKQAPLLVLDEPTAALDPLMESELYEKYRQFSADKTTIFISHRLASTRFCDRIVLMDHGEIAEEGTHEELLAKQGSYAQMYVLQSKYYKRQEAGLEGEEED